ncbi:3-phosphoshikimate 1-carboxyvinyltransferase [Methanococcus vannielii SB]|uniref:3-phosphoshikimate 1-carboxyvinyltransferase n=1 Tax=Methanococcus vannielii (strain ATCC 35089 / DSM 1224 / JCM 13029 / OCM 148 / SB) TaxID=406327 RepID=AROA_METVS|nr:3-phosphoshikimate 1-carboxyvinyltransferase [Methanococcus vannielii]A6UPK5.1 RecName: Full=3-phosphoshikimate 1-carboxyvinyltransferase; AltName: Full=5-enolpyruvylshikimate-3-phosphate synthase; Short=EPSP synthase; Short=EPSPS [Methanococcus vannielii SB]ABR54427.1 3-phosphoshikimate 1-carboxyvinyltransferase [Methanococcus vannielii SB]
MLIVKRTSEVKGIINAPPSKSYTHRAVISASLANGLSILKNPLNGADCLSSAHACRMLGAEITNEVEKWTIIGSKLKVPDNIIDIGNSGTTLRIITGISSQIPDGYAVITGDDSIRKRPMQPLLDALKQLGIESFSTRNNGIAPIIVKAGKITSNSVKIRGDMSSQFITSLMMTLPFSETDSEIILTTPLKSEPYLNITIDVLDKFGVKIEKIVEENKTGYKIKGKQSYRPCEYTIEGDYSSASYLIATGVLLNSDIEVKNVFKNSKQGDREIIEIVKKMGADVEINENNVKIKGPYNLKGIEIDVTNIPDLVPTIAVLGCFAEGKTVVYNGEHVRLKECDRLNACAVELSKMGADIEEKPDGLIITGTHKLTGSKLKTHDDHRLVMAFTIAGMLADGETVIEGEESVKISFPDFVDKMKSIGCNIEVI